MRPINWRHHKDRWISLISQVARPAEEGKVLIAESVAQLQRLWGEGGGWVPHQSSLTDIHPHDLQLTVPLAVERVSILVRFAVWTRCQ